MPRYGQHSEIEAEFLAGMLADAVVRRDREAIAEVKERSRRIVAGERADLLSALAEAAARGNTGPAHQRLLIHLAGGCRGGGNRKNV